MKKLNIKSVLTQRPLFSIIFYIVSLFSTFDIYCKNQVTPETPLLNIAGLPFLRMEFIAVIFAAAFCIGAVIARIFKKKSKTMLSFALGTCGVLSVFLFVFSVDFLQTISPTLRISHVIMTVSRVLAIVAGVSGGFVGAVFCVLKQKSVCKKTVAFSVLTAIILSVFSNLENFQPVLYLLCGILLIISSVANDYSKIEYQINKANVSLSEKITSIANLVLLTIMFMTAEGVLTVNAGISQISTAIISGLLILIALILCKKQSVLLSGVSLLFGAVIGYIVTHYGSEVIAYSGNRVLYKTTYIIWGICIVILIVLNTFLYIREKRYEKV